MTEVAAREITEADVDASIERVIRSAESIWDEWAWQVENRTWHIKGFGSWDEMRRAVYGGLTNVTAPRAGFPELVSRFRDAGLTQKETAETLGVTRATVNRNDPTARRVTNVTPEDVIDAEVVEDDELTPTQEDAMPTATRTNPRQALTDEQESEIVIRYERGERQADLAREYSVAENTVALALRRQGVEKRARNVEMANHAKQLDVVAATLRGLTFGLSELTWINRTVEPDSAKSYARDLRAASKEINRIANLLDDRSNDR